jgi:predicted dehydrogenase
MKSLRLAIIGASGRGALADSSHHPELGVTIVAGADVHEANLNRFIDRYQHRGHVVSGYADYRRMLEKERPDGVFITSPDYCHEEQACFALEAGIPVYLEKPMALSTAGCDRILRCARDHKVKLMLGHNMRYMSFTRKMKSLIDSGVIGEVKVIWCRHFISYGGDAYFRDWHADQQTANSLLLQKGAHDIDVIHWLAGQHSVRVSGMGQIGLYDKLPRRDPKNPPVVRFDASHWPPMEQKDFNPVINVEDHNMIMMQLGGGIQACYLQCHYTPDSCRNYTVIGTKGRIENHGDHHADTTIELWDRRVDHFRLHGDATFRTPPSEGSHGGADPEIVQGFVDYLRDLSMPAVTPQAARHAVAAGCAGAESIRNGGMPVDVPALDPDLVDYRF